MHWPLTRTDNGAERWGAYPSGTLERRAGWCAQTWTHRRRLFKHASQRNINSWVHYTEMKSKQWTHTAISSNCTTYQPQSHLFTHKLLLKLSELSGAQILCNCRENTVSINAAPNEAQWRDVISINANQANKYLDNQMMVIKESVLWKMYLFEL